MMHCSNCWRIANVNTNQFIVNDTALASRFSAGALRACVEVALQQGGARLDLSAVESVSESWADELFGVLVVRHSLPWVFERLDLRGVRPEVAQTIASAIRYRLTHEANGGDTAALLAAREALRKSRFGRCVA